MSAPSAAELETALATLHRAIGAKPNDAAMSSLERARWYKAFHEIRVAAALDRDACADEVRERLMAGSAIDRFETRRCYVCHHQIGMPHAYYEKMCCACGDQNWEKREQRRDLAGRVALVTGARIKIGYETALILLRAGA